MMKLIPRKSISSLLFFFLVHRLDQVIANRSLDFAETKQLVMTRSSKPKDSIISGERREFVFSNHFTNGTTRCALELKGDGNLVVERYDGNGTQTWQRIWQSGKHAVGKYYLHLQKRHGNLVIYKGCALLINQSINQKGEPNEGSTDDSVWASNTGRKDVKYLFMTNFCCLELENKNSKTVWKVCENDVPSPNPTVRSSSTPSTNPTIVFTSSPTVKYSYTTPSTNPTTYPTYNKSNIPSVVPSFSPTQRSSIGPSATDLPSLNPTSIPTRTFSPTLCGDRLFSDTERRNLILDILYSVSDFTVLSTPGTPQNVSATWLLDQDSFLESSLPNSWWCYDSNIVSGDFKKIIVQRYIVSVLYYSTGGQNWTRCSENDEECGSGAGLFFGDSAFMSSETHECSWYGVTCDENLHITDLSIEDNNLNGTIPNELSHLTSLQDLSLEQGDLHGTIPKSLSNLQNLKVLDLDFNLLTGSIPLDIFYNLTELQILDLNTNFLTGTIPNKIENLKKLQLLQVQRNFLSGTIPESLSKLNRLIVAEFYYNDFSGFMPTLVCENRYPMGNLTFLTADCLGNSILGTGPEIQCNCCSWCGIGKDDKDIIEVFDDSGGEDERPYWSDEAVNLEPLMFSD